MVKIDLSERQLTGAPQPRQLADQVTVQSRRLQEIAFRRI